MTSFVNGSLNANVGSAAIVDTGSNAAAGSINWGRWARSRLDDRRSSCPTAQTVTNNGGNLHYIYGGDGDQPAHLRPGVLCARRRNASDRLESPARSAR